MQIMPPQNTHICRTTHGNFYLYMSLKLSPKEAQVSTHLLCKISERSKLRALLTTGNFWLLLYLGVPVCRSSYSLFAIGGWGRNTWNFPEPLSHAEVLQNILKNNLVLENTKNRRVIQRWRQWGMRQEKERGQTQRKRTMIKTKHFQT